MEEMNNIAAVTKNAKKKPMELDLSNAHLITCVSKVRRGNALAHLDVAKPLKIWIVRKYS